jgi:hypothetical protein
MRFFKRSDQDIRTNRNVQSQVRGKVFSYHANRSERPARENARRIYEPPEKTILRQTARRRFLRRSSNALVAGAVLLLLCFSIRLNSDVRVVPIGNASSRLFLRDTKVYQASAQRLFESSWLNANKITVNAHSIADRLRQEFPELQVVSVALPLVGGQPAVFIQPSLPSSVLVTQSSGTFVLDSNGRALIAGNQVNNLERLKLPVITDQSGIKITAGKAALPSNDAQFIAEVVGQLKAQNIQVSSLVLPPSTSELFVKVGGAGYSIKFNLHGQAREEAGAYLAARQKLAAEYITPAEYVDVRVENRVYFK